MEINPLTPSTANLRSYTWLKLDYSRLFSSEFFAMANDAEFRAAFILWCKSMQQLPAGSLPNNDLALAGWAGKTLKQWERIKKIALHGWKLATDGRLYHPVLAEVVNDILNKDEGGKGEHTASAPPTKSKKSSSAERMAKKREREASQKMSLLNGQASHVTPTSVTCDADVTACDADVTATASHVTPKSVTNEGVGGDLDLELKKDLDLNNLKETPNNLSVIAPLETASPKVDPTKKPARKRAEPMEVLTEQDLVTTYGASPRYAQDWLAVRAKQKAPLTPSAMEGVISQSSIAGITIAQAIEVCAKKGWRGFNATWDFSDVFPDRQQSRGSNSQMPRFGETGLNDQFQIAAHVPVDPLVAAKLKADINELPY